eukprot:scaffold30969_cov60-Phaeocystis_antarctica.AAC.4
MACGLTLPPPAPPRDIVDPSSPGCCKRSHSELPGLATRPGCCGACGRATSRRSTSLFASSSLSARTCRCSAAASASEEPEVPDGLGASSPMAAEGGTVAAQEGQTRGGALRSAAPLLCRSAACAAAASTAAVEARASAWCTLLRSACTSAAWSSSRFSLSCWLVAPHCIRVRVRVGVRARVWVKVSGQGQGQRRGQGQGRAEALTDWRPATALGESESTRLRRALAACRAAPCRT